MKFSIVMPVYKQAKFMIERAIQSVVEQKYINWELIIYLNGNDDKDVLSMVDNLAKNDKRIIYFKSDVNVGWPKGISLCLEKATGDIFGFIAADDYIENEALKYVADEFKDKNIDILWLGQKYDVLDNGVIRTIGQDRIQNKYLSNKREICEYLSLFFNTVYYNAMHHYIKMDLLKSNKINFYDDYYSDCGGMTKALSVANKMLISDKCFYHLTRNTSLTSGKYQLNVYKMFASQWKSINELLSHEKYQKLELLQQIAERFERNHLGQIQLMCDKSICRDFLFNEVNLNYNERFLQIEKTLNDKSIQEMMYFYNREQYMYNIINSVMNLYKNALSHNERIEDIVQGSKYLKEFFEVIFEIKEKDVSIIAGLTTERIEKLLSCLLNPSNGSLFGYEFLLKIQRVYINDFNSLIKVIKARKLFAKKIKDIETNFKLNLNLNEKLASVIVFWDKFNSQNQLCELINKIIDNIDEKEDIEILVVNNKNLYEETDNIYKLEKKYEEMIGVINLDRKVNVEEAIEIGTMYARSDFIVKIEDNLNINQFAIL